MIIKTRMATIMTSIQRTVIRPWHIPSFVVPNVRIECSDQHQGIAEVRGNDVAVGGQTGYTLVGKSDRAL